MTIGPRRIRVATYNVHKCRGLDRQTSIGRIATVIRQLDADIVALQEILDVRNGKPGMTRLAACWMISKITTGLSARESHALWWRIRKYDAGAASPAFIRKITI